MTKTKIAEIEKLVQVYKEEIEMIRNTHVQSIPEMDILNTKIDILDRVIKDLEGVLS